MLPASPPYESPLTADPPSPALPRSQGIENECLKPAANSVNSPEKALRSERPLTLLWLMLPPAAFPPAPL